MSLVNSIEFIPANGTQAKGVSRSASDMMADPVPVDPLQQAKDMVNGIGAPGLAEAGPSIISSMNDDLEGVKKQVPVYDWYRFYPLGFCWGNYDGPVKGTGKEVVKSCGTTADWQNVNLRPVIQRILTINGVKVKLPAFLGLGEGVESAFAGLRTFTLVIYVLNVLCIIAIVAGLVATMVALVLPRRTVMFIALNLAVGGLINVYSIAIVMLMVLAGVGYTTGGLKTSLYLVVSFGVKYLVLFWINVGFQLVGVATLFSVWFGLVKQEAFEEGKSAAGSTSDHSRRVGSDADKENVN